MAADCSSNNSDCLPAGSTAANPCSPCLEPTKESFLSTLAEVARQVCAVGNQVKTFNQRIDRLRNRMERLERELANLPDPEEAVGVNDCANLDELPEEGADVLLACADGVKIGIGGEEDECSSLKNILGKWLKVPGGSNVVLLETPMVLTTPGTTTGLTDYDIYEPLSCNMHAIVFIAVGGVGTSGTTRLLTWVGNGRSMVTLNINGVSSQQEVAFAVIPLTADSIAITIASGGAGGTITGDNALLLGYIV